MLLYLLLKRDFEIFRLARSTVLHKDELWDSGNTLEWVFCAVRDRLNDLTGMYATRTGRRRYITVRQTSSNSRIRTRRCSFEYSRLRWSAILCDCRARSDLKYLQFKYWHDSSPLWSLDRLRETHYPTSAYNDFEEDPYVDPAVVLNHPLEGFPDTTEYSHMHMHEAVDAERSLEHMCVLLPSSHPCINHLYDFFSLGHWCGFIGEKVLYPSEPMLAITFRQAISKAGQFVASGSTPSGTSWKLVGLIKADPDQDRDGATRYLFTISYAAHFPPKQFEGTLSDNNRILSGTWTLPSGNVHGRFFFKRLTSEAMRFWPSSTELQLGKPRALWRFALRTVQDQVRRRLFSASYFAERQKTRQSYLQIIRSHRKPHTEYDHNATTRCYLSMTPSEARYYSMVDEYRQELSPKH